MGDIKVIDISLPIRNGMVVFPGTTDTLIKGFKSSSGNSLSEISFTSHTGTHIDAPSHAIEKAESIDEIPLNKFFGPCRIIDLTKCDVSISIDSLKAKNINPSERILIKTKNSQRGFDKFFDDYIFLSPEAAEYLAQLQITLVGIDSLSIKQKGSKDNAPHTNLLSKGIPILEGLNLSTVTEGEYTLSAFPLAFEGIDGSPVRALLLPKA